MLRPVIGPFDAKDDSTTILLTSESYMPTFTASHLQQNRCGNLKSVCSWLLNLQ